MSSPLVRYWCEGGPDGAGRTFDAVLALDDHELEQRHDWVQWMFPLPEPSASHPGAPVLTEADRAALRADPATPARARAALARFRRFLEGTPWWTMPADHNHLRITRALRALTLLGLQADAEALHDWLVSRPTGVGDEARAYWARAIGRAPAGRWARWTSPLRRS